MRCFVLCGKWLAWAYEFSPPFKRLYAYAEDCYELLLVYRKINLTGFTIAFIERTAEILADKINGDGEHV
jgi:hypothetical protein